MKIPIIISRFVFVLIAVALAGCVHSPKSAPPNPTNHYLAPAPKPPQPFFLFAWMNKLSKIIPQKNKPPAATTPQRAGTIRKVNTAEKFVLIESCATPSIVPGETYVAVGKATETASLRMTNLKNPPFLIADIVSGNPSPGEKIYLATPLAQPASTPAPKPASKKPKDKPCPQPAPDRTAPQTHH